MRRFPNIGLALVFAVTVAIGAFQGGRLDRMREAERFYRWVLAATTQSRFWADLSAESSAETPEEKAARERMMDSQLFESILQATDPVLPDTPLAKEDYDSQGNPMRKLVRFARDDANDKAIYDLCAGPVLKDQRADFLKFSREKRLLSVSSEFDPNAVYAQGAGVSLGNIFFGFRKLAANFVWLQVDKYWHQGYEQRMLPLMKTSVTLDPNFVDAFLLGAWHLAYNKTAGMADTPWPVRQWSERFQAWVGDKELYLFEAVDFLKDGIRKNPRNYRLFFDLGYGIYNQKMKDYGKAVLYLSEAVLRRHDKWVPRMLYHSMTANGQYGDALAGWQDYLKRNPQDETAPRFIAKNQGLLAEKRYEDLMEQAAQATDPAQAEQFKTEAAKARQEAEAIWNGPMMDSDPYALGRIMRMKAKDLLRNGDYIEAVAILENARWKSNDFWDEASEMIIDTKGKAGIPLSTSEKMAVIRKEQEEKHKKALPGIKPANS